MRAGGRGKHVWRAAFSACSDFCTGALRDEGQVGILFGVVFFGATETEICLKKLQNNIAGRLPYRMK